MKNLAYCGLLCNECEIYKATIANDCAYKEQVAKNFSSPQYPLTSDDIKCYGCSDNNKAIFKFCEECEIRLCGIAKSLANCGQCKSFACDKLHKAFEHNPDNKKRLEEVFSK